VKYPTQEDAQFLVDYRNFLNNALIAGSSVGSKIVNKSYEISQKEFDRVFGDESPWALKKNNSNYKFEIKWDDEKAKRLGL
jgi:hypothetical protein